MKYLITSGITPDQRGEAAAALSALGWRPVEDERASTYAICALDTTRPIRELREAARQALTSFGVATSKVVVIEHF